MTVSAHAQLQCTYAGSSKNATGEYSSSSSACLNK